MAWRRIGDEPLSESMMTIQWRIYAALGEDELIEIQPICWKLISLSKAILLDTPVDFNLANSKMIGQIIAMDHR